MSRMPSSATLARRDLLGLGCAAGTAFLAEQVASAQSPASAVSDRTSSIRLTSLRATICRDRVFVKLGTNHGISGWGEIKGVVPAVAKALADAMFELLDGQNPTRIEHLWQTLYRAERNQRGGAFMLHCIAGIDMALWDITGQLWGVPVYRLLGGPTRDSIRVYPSSKAIKIGNQPKAQSGDPADIEKMVEAVRQARQKVGKDGSVMFDAHSAVPAATLIQFASAVEPYELLFLEEPAVPENIVTFKRIKQHVEIPIACGERYRTIWGILPYLA